MEDALVVQELLAVLEDYAPSIPEELVEYYLQQVGFVSSDPSITRLVGLAAHKMLEDVMHDAMQYQRMRPQSASAASGAAAGAAGGTTAPRAVLTMEDLAASLKEYGVNICKPEYVSDDAQ